MRTCSKCKKSKPEDEFGNNKNRPDGKNLWCKTCNSASTKRYYERNRDEILERKKQRYQDNIELEREKAREKYWDDPEIHRARTNKWRFENKDKVKKYQREYVRANLETYRCYNQNRRARLKSNGGSHSVEQWELLCDSFGNVCLSCKEAKPLTVDHIVPISEGGTNYIWNIQPLCKECNSSKGTKIIDFREEFRL